MRHARALPAAPGQSDHDRPLGPDGIAAARRMGRLLEDVDLVPARVVTSTAVRARATAEQAIDAGAWDAPLDLEPGFYQASVEDVVAIVSTASEVERLLIVGHQPTWGTLVAHLTGESVEMRTATVAVVGLPVDTWADILSVRGSLVGVHHAPPAPGV